MSLAKRFFLWASLALAGSACTAQNIYMKTLEKNAPPSPQIQVDRFLFNKPMGAVDVVFVVDNTESLESALPAVQTAYTGLLATWAGTDVHALDYRMQVVTTPNLNMPKNFIGSGLDSAGQLAELFDSFAGSGRPPIFSNRVDREHGFVDPFVAIQAVLPVGDFGKRLGVPLFVVTVLGDDFDPSKSEDAFSQEGQQLSAALDTARGFDKTHLLRVSRDEGATDTSCPKFRATPRWNRLSSALPWRTNTALNLCDGTWPVQLAQTLHGDIVDFKKRLVLSFTPYDPETMVLRAASHLYRYGQDFTYDAAINEIAFLHDPGLVDGDLLELSYYLMPPPETLSGSPNPNPSGASSTK